MARSGAADAALDLQLRLVWHLTASELFDIFELGDGRLHARLTFTITSPRSYVYSSEPSCFTGGVGGSCACEYGGVARPGTIDIELPTGVP